MLAEQALGGLGVGEDDERRIRLWVVMGWNQYQVNVALAEDYADRIEQHGVLPRDAKALGDTARLRGGIANIRGEMAGAEGHHRRALQYYQSIDDQGGMARVHLALAHLRRLAGSSSEARDQVRWALEKFRLLGDDNRLLAMEV